MSDLLTREEYQAIAVFSRNVAVYPESPNVYDSLGDGYDANEQFEKAKASYEKACTMGRASNDPNTQIYCGNVERMAKRVFEKGYIGFVLNLMTRLP